MKNVLNYYYNLNIENIHQKNKNYYFKVNNLQYMLLECVNEEINDIYSLNVYLTKNYPFYKIILNKENKIITIINETNYILLEINNNIKELNLNEIIKINNIPIVNFNKLRRDNWYTLWTNKIDYFEYQINQMGKKYPIIRESFNYYIGLAETAISLIKSINNEGMYLSLSHKRISNAFDLYNPLNLIIDVRIRDICEYFKFCFFENKNTFKELELFLNYNKLSYNESVYFLARMLFPTYYFDLYEKIIADEVKEEEIKKIISKVDKYEKLLKYIYLNFKNNNLYIEWLEKIN